MSGALGAPQSMAAGTPGPASPPDLACATYATDLHLNAALLGRRILPPCAESVTTSDPNDPDVKAENVFLTLQHGFDVYSWLTFVALNSPQDPSQHFGPNLPTVWESYKQIDDVMLEKGRAPNPDFTAPHIVPEKCSRDPTKPTSLVIHMVQEAFDQPFDSGPLVDQNGKFALNVILMNRVMFEKIVHDNLYNWEGQQAFQGLINFLPGKNADNVDPKTIGPPGFVRGPGEQLGAYILKASWKEMGPGDDESRFHTIWAQRYFPKETGEESCDIVKLGLVGFHVGHKTTTRNQWIWSTFEHVDNVPDVDKIPSCSPQAPKFNFFDACCSAAKCRVNGTPPQPWNARKPPAGFRSQIVRTGGTLPVTPPLNAAVQKLLAGTVWEHYKLVLTQWPADSHCAGESVPGNQPDATCLAAPTLLANTTLETFVQPEISSQSGSIGTPQATSSCIGCHNNAATHHVPATESDFTYILEKAQKGER